MKIFNSNGKYDDSKDIASIFLAGPTLRNNPHNLTPWREKALEILKNLGFDGHVYVPEPFAGTHSEQIDWEIYHLEKAGCILFWVPRDLKILPAFTTNIEFGEWMKSGKIVLGAPREAEKVSYMIYRANKLQVPVFDTLEATIQMAIKMSD